MRYIQVPEAFVVYQPVTGEPLDVDGNKTTLDKAERITFPKFVRLLCMLASSKLNAPNAPSALTLIDIRNKGDSLVPGQLWECPDDWHKILTDTCGALAGMAAQTMFSAETHLRAIVDAPTKPPAVVATPAPVQPS